MAIFRVTVSSVVFRLYSDLKVGTDHMATQHPLLARKSLFHIWAEYLAD